jgi:uncharacterized membrane protein
LDVLKDLLNNMLPFFDAVPGVRAALASLLVFFIPGFAWTLLLFRGRQINWLERLALSIGISIAIVTISILALNLLFGVRISGINAFITILVITAIPLAWYFLVRFLARKKSRDSS